MADRVPAEVFPPGEFLRDELEARGWTQTEFAEILGRPVRLVNEILAGKRGITPQTALEIGAAFGTSAELWLNLEATYRLWHAGPAPERIVREGQLRERFPVREMIRRRWIEGSGEVQVLETQVKRFFSIDSLDEPPPIPAHWAPGVGVQGPATLNRAEEAWLFRVQQVADSLAVGAYSEQALRDGLPRLQALMAEPDDVRLVPALLAECGVRFVVVEPLPDSAVDGVCFWLESPASPVVGMSLRFDRIDWFWFVLRHELEHVLRGETSLDADLDPDAPPAAGAPKEQAANAAAAEFCLPAARLDDFAARVHPVDSEQRIVAFARSVGMHPGIVVGEMQKRTGRYARLRRHLVKVRDILIESATTDGYGHFLPSPA